MPEVLKFLAMLCSCKTVQTVLMRYSKLNNLFKAAYPCFSVQLVKASFVVIISVVKNRHEAIGGNAVVFHCFLLLHFSCILQVFDYFICTVMWSC